MENKNNIENQKNYFQFIGTIKAINTNENSVQILLSVSSYFQSEKFITMLPVTFWNAFGITIKEQINQGLFKVDDRVKIIGHVKSKEVQSKYNDEEVFYSLYLTGKFIEPAIIPLQIPEKKDVARVDSEVRKPATYSEIAHALYGDSREDIPF